MRLMLSVLLMSLLAAAPAVAKHWHENGKSGKKHEKHVEWDGDHAGCYFRRQDVRIIREYYAPRYRSLPPGLAKKFYRTGHLPPGWKKKMQPLPVVVERELVVLPRGYKRGFIDGAVVVYSPRSQVMIDIVAVFGG